MHNRRQFLQRAGISALALPLAAYSQENEDEERPLWRITCNSWPFRGYFDTPKGHQYRNPKYPLIEQQDFPQFLVDNFGIHSTEFLYEHFADTSPAYIDKVKAGMRKAHSTAANIMAVRVPGGLYNPKTDREAALTEVSRWIDIAVALGAPSITVGVGGGPPFDTNVAAENVRPIVQYARDKHIRVLFHNDDIRRESADELLAIIQKVKSRYLGMCPDFGNFATRSPEYALETLRRLMPYATNICHAKDGTSDDHHFFPDNFAASMKLTKAVGFKGKYSLEYEGLDEPIPGVKALLAKTLSYL